MKKNKKQKNSNWRHRLILKIILNFWTLAAMIFFLADFFSGNRFDSTASSIGIIYLALLGIYVGEKEYTRWKNKFVSKFLGESFVILWTIIMVIMVIIAPFTQGLFRVPEQFAIIYSSVIGVFAVTQYSKTMRERKK